MKFLNLLLSMSLIFSMSVPAFAKDQGLETAIGEVKTRLDIGELENFESSYRTDETGKTVYYFNWSNSDDEDYEYISVAYTDGVIISYDRSFNGEYDNDRRFPAVSSTDALKTAEEFIKKANPDIAENIKITPQGASDIYDNSYYFEVLRTENSLPVINSGGNIAVSKSANEVRYFHFQYDTGIEFLPTDGILTKDEAKTAYSEKLAPDLCYDYYYDYNNKKLNVYLKYESAVSRRVINAYDGTVFEVPQEDFILKSASGGSNSALKEMAADTEESRLSEAELKEVSNISGLMSEAEIEALIRSNTVLNIGSDLTVSNISLNRDSINQEKYIYGIRFRNSDEENYKYAYVSANAKTGEILSFNKNGVYLEEQKQSLEDEKKAAEEAFELLAPEKYSEFTADENESAGRISYTRLKNGLKVSGDSVSFGFDSEDNLVSYYLNYTDISEFPSISGVISAASAIDFAVSKHEFTAAYVIDYEKKQATPVYCFIENSRIDEFEQNPFTGNFINNRGEDIEDDKGAMEYSDIENHYAKEKFLKLAEFGIGFDGGELLPDKQITQGEYLTLLNEIFGYSTDIDEIYKRFISNGTITKEERQDNSAVTRETAAILMIREMGAKAYAEYEDIYVQPFEDVTENKGYIALLKAMGVVSGDGNGNFNPKNTITRGEALIMIYNYLNR